MSTLRITNQTIGDRFLLNVQRNQRLAAQTQEQISTGSRVNRPSDDPLAAAQARLRNADLDAIADGKRSANNATSWLTSVDDGLKSITDLLGRARELTLQAANATYNGEQRQTIARELTQIIESAKQAMNVRSGDAYVFAGSATDTAPYAAGSDAYLGNEDAVVRGLGPGGSIQVNATFDAIGGNAPITARSILGEGSGAGDGRVLDALQTIVGHLMSGTDADVAALGTSDVAALQRNLDAISNARAAAGGAQNRVDAALSRMDLMTQSTQQILSDTTGVDYAEALTDLTRQQTAYQAALQSGAVLMQTSLLDFLR